MLSMDCTHILEEHNMKTFKTISLSFILVLLIAACGGSPAESQTQDQPAATLDATAMNAAIEATVSSELTRIAAENPTNTPEPTATEAPVATLPPTDAPSPTPTISEFALDNQALFVEDVTIPDGTEIVGGTEFVKTWRLQNIGLNTWTTEYTFVFVNGDRMEGFPIELDREVVPGDVIDISITMTAPLEGGAYTGYWMFATEEDVVFGVGDTGSEAVIVSIFVIEPTPEPSATATTSP